MSDFFHPTFICELHPYTLLLLLYAHCYNVPLYEHTKVYPFCYCLTFGLFQFFAAVNSATVSFLVHVSVDICMRF